MINAFVALSSAVASLLAPAAVTQDTAALAPPPAERIVVDVTSVNGSGCPGGSADVDVSAGNTTLTVTYSDFSPAWAGQGADPTDFRKNCQISLHVRVPDGFTYALTQAEYRGFAHLARGATAVQSTSAYFMGMSETIQRSRTFEGPFSDYWAATHRVDHGDLAWHPCGGDRNLNINTALRVSAGSAEPSRASFITLGSPPNGSVRAVFHLAWRWCSDR
jgi:hypothetical protein